jgi:ubiquinone/menaquinone biosynthesis C-methylase UbiE
MQALWIALSGLALVVVVGIVWRIASRRHSLPCPSWLAWSLDLPIMQGGAGKSSVIDRLRLSEGMRVVDVGCWPGRLTVPIAEAVGASGEVVALDIQQSMLEKLERKLKRTGVQNVRQIRGGAGDGLLPEDAFDRAVLVTVLGEIPEREKALREIHESLKAEGFLSVTEIFPDPHFQRRSVVRDLAQRTGFECREEWGGPLSFTMHLYKRKTGPR